MSKNAPIGRLLKMKLGTNKQLDYIEMYTTGNKVIMNSPLGAIILKLGTNRKLVANIEDVPY
jgi:hypothetical protein